MNMSSAREIFFKPPLSISKKTQLLSAFEKSDIHKKMENSPPWVIEINLKNEFKIHHRHNLHINNDIIVIYLPSV